jgi:hypothetical protein
MVQHIGVFSSAFCLLDACWSPIHFQHTQLHSSRMEGGWNNFLRLKQARPVWRSMAPYMLVPANGKQLAQPAGSSYCPCRDMSLASVGNKTARSFTGELDVRGKHASTSRIPLDFCLILSSRPFSWRKLPHCGRGA